MFMEVHVRVTIPGLNLYSRSSRWGTSSDLVLGLILFTMRSYSLNTKCNSMLYILNLSSCKRTILALSGISIPILDKHLASLMSVRISLSKLTYNLLLSGCLMIRVAYKPALAFSTSWDHFCLHRYSNEKRVYPILLYILTNFLDSFCFISYCGNCSMGPEILWNKCLDQVMLPETVGKFLTIGGLFLYF